MSRLTITATTQPTQVVARWLVSPPITAGLPVSLTSGSTANGIPNDSTTCESTNVRVGSKPSVSIANAGPSVIRRRTSMGTLQCSSPCMIIAPA
ncbi:Uncharacterised protein [Mycobacterium tuberculosis]|nr:Uncharacterised protein [Mycobacterium tuberculosis]